MVHESRVRDHFAARYRGRTEVQTDFGRVDVVLPDEVVEVEPFVTWRHGVRQALAYAQETGKRPAVAVYGSIPPQAAERVWERCAGLVGLYLLDRVKWHRIGSEAQLGRWWEAPPDHLGSHAPKRPVMTPEDAPLVDMLAAWFGISDAVALQYIKDWRMLRQG